MNKICKEYIYEIKALFPIRRKPERDYIKKIMVDIENFCEESEVTTKQELYESYGKPNDVVNNYLATVDTEYIAKQISISRFIRIAVAVFLVLATIATAVFCITLTTELQYIMEQEQNSSIETIIEEHN